MVIRKRTQNFGIAVDAALYHRYKAVIKAEGKTITEDIESYLNSRVKGTEGEVLDFYEEFEQLKSAMDYIYPEWRNAES